MIWGIKETARQFNVYLADLQAHLNSGQLYKNKNLLCKFPLTIELQEEWAPASIAPTS